MAFPSRNSSRGLANVLGAVLRDGAPQPSKGQSAFAPRDGSATRDESATATSRLDNSPAALAAANAAAGVMMPGSTANPGLVQADGNQSPIPPRGDRMMRAVPMGSTAPQSGMEKTLNKMVEKSHPRPKNARR